VGSKFGKRELGLEMGLLKEKNRKKGRRIKAMSRKAGMMVEGKTLKIEKRSKGEERKERSKESERKH